MSFNIREGKHKGLCYACKHSHVILYDSGDETVTCNANHPYKITAQVEKCNEYQNMMEKSEYQMEKIAWIIDVDASHKMVGFVPPGSERHKKLIDD